MVYDTLTTVIAKSKATKQSRASYATLDCFAGARNDGINDSVIRKCRPERQRDKQEDTL
jgi:hypothetical protein